MTSGAILRHLNVREKQALSEFVDVLAEQFNDHVRSVILFGSKARGDSTPDSDIDVLVVTKSDDWRLRKLIRYLAADVCLKYDVALSPRIWSISHRQEMEEIPALLYRNIYRDGVELLDMAG